jgi:hypothetical protein
MDLQVITLNLYIGEKVSHKVKDHATYIKEIYKTTYKSIVKAQE